MTYVDSSVVLAYLFVEDRIPPDVFWDNDLVASRLLEYEVWNRINARRLGEARLERARLLLHRVSLIELAPPFLARALEPFPVPVRTLDALHLATLDHLHRNGANVELASYDQRLLAAARSLHIPVLAL